MSLLAMRPLDGRLHGLIARRAAKERDWAKALHWAELSVDNRPGAIDPWLIRAAAEREISTAQRSNASMTQALLRLHKPPDEELRDYLLRHYPRPSAWLRHSSRSASEGWSRGFNAPSTCHAPRSIR
ncbi:MAG: hypothetical protein JKY37_00925 [Nannocystaceae bacterium]|nr:hypothetical protein [Nannocystaceae bacterium]